MKKLKNSQKSGTGKADFASMIERLSLFKINSSKPFFTQNFQSPETVLIR